MRRRNASHSRVTEENCHPPGCYCLSWGLERDKKKLHEIAVTLGQEFAIQATCFSDNNAILLLKSDEF